MAGVCASSHPLARSHTSLRSPWWRRRATWAPPHAPAPPCSNAPQQNAPPVAAHPPPGLTLELFAQQERALVHGRSAAGASDSEAAQGGGVGCRVRGWARGGAGLCGLGGGGEGAGEVVDKGGARAAAEVVCTRIPACRCCVPTTPACKHTGEARGRASA